MSILLLEKNVKTVKLKNHHLNQQMVFVFYKNKKLMSLLYFHNVYLMDGDNHTLTRESLVFSKKDNGIYYYQPNGDSGYLYYNIPSIGHPKASVDCVKNTELLHFPYDSIFVNRNKKIFMNLRGKILFTINDSRLRD